MSFFGFDTALPRDRGHQGNAPGFGQAADPFAGLTGNTGAGGHDALDFEDTYDGLGDQLDETDDAFNDETFGGEPATQGSVGRDFDFSGQTAQIAGTMQEEQMLYAARQPPPSKERLVPQSQPNKPAKTGYERYGVPELQANASLWGMAPKKSAAEPQSQASYPLQPDQIHHQRSDSHGAAGRKMMSLEEVEAAMRAQKPKPSPQTGPIQHQVQQGAFYHDGAIHPMMQGTGLPQILQRPHQPPQQQFPPQHFPPQQYLPQHTAQRQPIHAELPGHGVPPIQHGGQPQILQRQKTPSIDPYRQVHSQSPHHQPPHQPPHQPKQILQNPNRLSGPGQPIAQHRPNDNGHGPASTQIRGGPQYSGQIVTHPEQLLQLSDHERAAFLLEDAKRAKRNHKIHLLSKDNGLMTPQDKNFITRIQLQQLVTATGGVDDQGPEASLIEDFYYQVYSQIRGAPRQSPHQPANQFAQTYLFQTGGRHGASGRRQYRGGDNHMQRMEQQVQRAVEAAKAKPKNKQLVIEGSLGKISFSNAKTPKPLLNIKRTDSGPQTPGKQHAKLHHSSVVNRKETLRDIENVYMTLMRLEDHERHLPPPINETSDPETVQIHMEWQQRLQALNQRLKKELRIGEPLIPNSSTPHPFIAILSHSKGKRAIPRIFRHIDEQQRNEILTMIMVHLDMLDVIRQGIAQDQPLPRVIREEIELFANAVVPPLFALISEAPLNMVAGLIEYVLVHTNLPLITRTRTGLSLLTMFISRAELLKQAAPESNSPEWHRWNDLYCRLFDTVEPVLPVIFPGNANDTEDIYVWQFLAAMGVGANPEQQQRLVIGVKDRVMETVVASKALPPDMSSVRLGHVNLFMRAIGLDVELLG